MERVLNFLKDTQTYYLATVENDQPHVRPFGTAVIFENKLYIQTGKGKKVANQLDANGKAEICAMNVKGEWMRVTGTLVRDDRKEAQDAVLSQYPDLQEIYTTGDDGNTAVYYFTNATATIESFSSEKVEFQF